MGTPYKTDASDHDGEGQATGSKKYIPENLHGVALYDEVCDWIDHVLDKGEIEHDFLILDELVTQLITIFKDKGSLAAYYNLFVRSIIGTQSALDFLLDLLQFEPRGEWTEWHHLLDPTLPNSKVLPPYKLIVDFGDTYPHAKDPLVKYIDWDKLLDLFELIKNERTLIAQVRMQDCANMLIFDRGSFDNELFDNLQGYVYRGVRFCLYEKHKDIIYKSINFYTNFHTNRVTYHNSLWGHNLSFPPVVLDYGYFATHFYFQKCEVFLDFDLLYPGCLGYTSYILYDYFEGIPYWSNAGVQGFGVNLESEIPVLYIFRIGIDTKVIYLEFQVNLYRYSFFSQKVDLDTCIICKGSLSEVYGSKILKDFVPVKYLLHSGITVFKVLKDFEPTLIWSRRSLQMGMPPLMLKGSMII